MTTTTFDTPSLDVIQFQHYVNTGMAWRLEGAVGRQAMSMLESGIIMLPDEPHTDYWGNTVPARSWLEPGSKGTRELVVAEYGEEWAQALEEVEA